MNLLFGLEDYFNKNEGEDENQALINKNNTPERLDSGSANGEERIAGLVTQGF